ncbi:hypothetical protein SECTIM467_90 [Brevibacillus phage SecTim467]|uniref:Uncharacterized protein n=2 Tax=Jenstvirus jenst TaxID=1982225 RepID=A0A0K2CNY5_9CAUD|nr:hypothetical protein AVV11_gp106 [Brevibacillus phage Jenst]ALA07214.1 hypothetical protein JENST_85 [Brevibacillus phage Jenst]ALA07433.1 hypothetical protein SECTIM467_90 [Brevibacillus phage SecTim467]
MLSIIADILLGVVTGSVIGLILGTIYMIWIKPLKERICRRIKAVKNTKVVDMKMSVDKPQMRQKLDVKKKNSVRTATIHSHGSTSNSRLDDEDSLLNSINPLSPINPVSAMYTTSYHNDDDNRRSHSSYSSHACNDDGHHSSSYDSGSYDSSSSYSSSCD